MDGGAWWAAVHGVVKSRTWLSGFTFTFHFHALEKEMATQQQQQQQHSFNELLSHRAFLSLPPAKSLQSCPTLCDPIDGSPPGSPIAGILQARTLQWVAISFSNAWKWKVKVKSLSRVQLFATPWTAAHQASLSMGFSRQEYWSGMPLSSICYSWLNPKGELYSIH